MKTVLELVSHRLPCQPATRPTGRAKRGPEALISHKLDTAWQGRLPFMHVHHYKYLSGNKTFQSLPFVYQLLR